MTQSTTPQTPGVPATMNTVWPPSNPSSTVIPFPLPWGQTGCCPPGGMDALMKCYCDIQQASAFIGQIMLDQINNNPAIIAAIIAQLEKSGSTVPLVGVTNGSLAQPGQVGEFVMFQQTVAIPATANYQTAVSMGVLNPGDWDIQISGSQGSGIITSMNISLVSTGLPAGTTENGFFLAFDGNTGDFEVVVLSTPVGQLSLAQPALIVANLLINQLGAGTGAGDLTMIFTARRMR